MSSRELMLQKLPRARDWEVRWSQELRKAEGRRVYYIQEGIKCQKCDSVGDEEKRYQEDPECLLRIAPISSLLCVSGVVGTWASAVKMDQVKVRVNKLYITVMEAVVDFSSIHGHYSCAYVCTMGGRSGCKHGRCFWGGSDTFISIDFL